MAQDAEQEISAHKRKQRLRMLYKYWKNGKIDLVVDSITSNEKWALCQYYGVCDL